MDNTIEAEDVIEVEEISLENKQEAVQKMNKRIKEIKITYHEETTFDRD